MKRKSNIKRMVTLTVVICLVINLLIIKQNELLVYAEGTTTVDNGDGTQTILNGSGDAIYDIDFRGDAIEIIGEHAKSSATISYLTKCFNISLDIACVKGDVPYNDPKKVSAVSLLEEPKDVVSDVVTTTYRINKEDFFSSVVELLINKYNYDIDKIYEILQNEGVTVYLNNIFCMIERSGGSGTEADRKWGTYQTLDEIMNAPKESGYGEWGSGTQAVLPHYFGMEITVRMNAYSMDVEFYDTVNKKVVESLKDSKKYMVGQQSNYRIPNFKAGEKNQVTLGGIIYNLTQAASLKYDGYSVSKDINYAGSLIDFKFDTEADSTLRINVVPADNDCKVIVQYVDEEKKIIKDNINGGGLDNNEKYEYKGFETKPVINGTAYEYKQEWSYEYTNNSGAKKTSNGTANPSFTIKDAKQGSTVYLKLVYKKALDKEVESQETITYFSPDATGSIQADSFNVTAGIPTTENLKANVFASEYLISAAFKTTEKTVNVPITVTKTYTLKWSEPKEQTPEEIEAGKPPVLVPKSENAVVTKVVSVQRRYKYTEITNIDYYKIGRSLINNYALPGGSITLTPSGYSVPSLNYQHYSSESDRVIEPKQKARGIVLATQVVSSSGNTKPEVPNEDFAPMIELKVDKYKVRNDYLEFGSKIVLDNNYKEEQAPSLNKSGVTAPTTISSSVLSDRGLRIEATKNNGSYSSSGSITYEQVTGFQSSKGPSLSYSVNSINNVIIHTPVYCKADLINDNKKYVQLVNPNIDCIPIVLDEDGISSDFIVDISNFGYHSSMFGYGTRDYSINILGDASYIASKNGVLRNEVKFPFDVYIDIGNDNKTANDKLISAETWYTVGLNKYRFYVPMYVKEGIYTVEFRSIAVNGTSRLTATEVEANKSRSNYVATDSMQVQISGKIQGLTIYDIGDYPLWKDTFRVNKSTKLKLNVGGIDGTISKVAYDKSNLYYYTVGTNNQYGISTGRSNKYTFPLIAGSHPQYANQGALKAGYTWRFTLDSIGGVMEQDDSYIVIEPRFYYVDKAGKNREEVDLYYSETIVGSKKTIVKVGSTLDKKNVKTAKVGDVGLAIPINELKVTAGLRNTSYAKWITNVNAMYSYHGITSSNSFKTFSNSSYTDRILSSNSGQDVLNNGITEAKLIKLKQSYYFNYMLPNTVKAVKKGRDVASYAKKYGITYKENFWKTEGYLIININITAYDGKGNAYLSYINTSNYQNYGHNSMWLLEGAQAKKTDYYGTEFTFEVGDFLMINAGKTSVDDYKPGGIY